MNKLKIENFFVENTIKSVIGLSITTTISYGTLFYSFTIMSLEFEKYFDWSKSFLFGVFSIGLLMGGLITPYIGKKLDHYGARIIMSIGSILAFFGLILLSQIETKLEYTLSIFFIEIVSTFIQYEAAFVAFSQIAKDKARLPMTQITLLAGFASTIFWPFITLCLNYFSWREVYLILSLFHLIFAFPIHYFTLPKELKTNEIVKSSPKNICQNKKKSMTLIGITFCCIAFPITVVQTHLLSILESFKVEMAFAIILGALIGPAQVASRVLDMLFSKKTTPMSSAFTSSILILISMFALLLSGYNLTFAVIFVIFYGAGQGLNYIARGGLPLYILGSENYGKNTGILNLFIKIVIAFSPFTFALMLDNFGNIFSIIILLILSLISIISLFLIPTITKDKNV